MDSANLSRVESLLRQSQLFSSEDQSSASNLHLREVYNEICELVFDDHGVQDLWHEPVLRQLNALFRIKTPSVEAFGEILELLRSHEKDAGHINDVFFGVLSKDATIEEVYQAVSTVSTTNQTLLARLIASDLLEKVRATDAPPSEKVTLFLESLRDDLDVDMLLQESARGCLKSLREREGLGRVNALLVKQGQETALVIPLELALNQGSGQIHCAVSASKEFEAALKRALIALQISGYLPKLFDAVCCLSVTGPEYVGSSMALAAAAGMYGTGAKIIIDPYTAFTGDVLLEQGEWKVKSVIGLSRKLAAAKLNGCRQVYVPKENIRDLQPNDKANLTVIGVDNVLEIVFALHRSPTPCREDSLQSRKINLLRVYCHTFGWALSEPRAIQSGSQYRVVPFNMPELTLSIYSSGTHVPKTHPHDGYQSFLKDLGVLDEPAIPIRPVQKTYAVQEQVLRQKLQARLETLQPQEKRDEQYCEYSFKFERGQERLAVKQYTSGKLHIQGVAGELLKSILESIIPLYKAHYPSAALSVDEELLSGSVHASPKSEGSPAALEVPPVPFPYIGTDESGKGDYFGPMVAAGVLVDKDIQAKLEKLGVKDSKLLSDKRCHELASQIRDICGTGCEEVEISPETYNKLYEEFRREGQNLNHMLAWGHARAIETLLERQNCSHAVADQFGDEKYIQSRLMQKGRRITLKQLTKGERYTAVAAASILARDKFLCRIDRLSEDYAISLPKGASDAVVAAGRSMVEMKGREELRKVAKLHHKTTEKILKPTGEAQNG